MPGAMERAQILFYSRSANPPSASLPLTCTSRYRFMFLPVFNSRDFSGSVPPGLQGTVLVLRP